MWPFDRIRERRVKKQVMAQMTSERTIRAVRDYLVAEVLDEIADEMSNLNTYGRISAAAARRRRSELGGEEMILLARWMNGTAGHRLP